MDSELYSDKKWSGGSVSVIVPARNESASIRSCLNSLRGVLPDAELLVVDGGADDTGEIVVAMAQKDPLIRYIHNAPDRGKGHAIQRGCQEARGDILVQFDADLQFDAADIPALCEPLISGRAMLVMGSRYLPGARYAVGGGHRARWFGNQIFSMLLSALCQKRLTDGLAGLKAWRAAFTRQCPLRCDTYSYELELPLRACMAGMQVVEVPVSYRDRIAGTSTVRVIPVALRLIWDMVSIRCRG